MSGVASDADVSVCVGRGGFVFPLRVAVGMVIVEGDLSEKFISRLRRLSDAVSVVWTYVDDLICNWTVEPRSKNLVEDRPRQLHLPISRRVRVHGRNDALHEGTVFQDVMHDDDAVA